jgi:hypothetical protein
MHRPLLLAGLLLAAMASLAAGCHGQAPRHCREGAGLAVETLPLRLGASEIALVVHTAATTEPTYVVLHTDEQTAVDRGLEAIRARGGRLVEVLGQGDRLVTFELAGRTWRFDPNRIFTPVGAAASLDAHNEAAPADVLAAALVEVQRFADAVLDATDAGALPVLVALHNNTESFYSAASYAPGGDLENDAAAVHLPPGEDPDDFFFVTDGSLFEALAGQGFAAVLQDNERVVDDGSLSVWAGRRGLPYVNIEAQQDHGERQARMLEALARVLASRTADGAPSQSPAQRPK